MLDDCLLRKPLSVPSRVFLSMHTGVLSGPKLGAYNPGNQAGSHESRSGLMGQVAPDNVHRGHQRNRTDLDYGSLTSTSSCLVFLPATRATRACRPTFLGFILRTCLRRKCTLQEHSKVFGNQKRRNILVSGNLWCRFSDSMVCKHNET